MADLAEKRRAKRALECATKCAKKWRANTKAAIRARAESEQAAEKAAVLCEQESVRKVLVAKGFPCNTAKALPAKVLGDFVRHNREALKALGKAEYAARGTSAASLHAYLAACFESNPDHAWEQHVSKSPARVPLAARLAVAAAVPNQALAPAEAAANQALAPVALVMPGGAAGDAP